MWLENPVLRLATALLSAAMCLHAQNLEWRPLASTVTDAASAGFASGRVSQVWVEGRTLYARTAGQAVFQMDLSGESKWSRISAMAPVEQILPPGIAKRLPESNAILVAHRWQPGVLIALGENVYRSEDNGASWTDLTSYRGKSLLGGRALSAAFLSKSDLIVATETGVWRSVDDGDSWVDLNEGLPALSIERITSIPADSGVLRVDLPNGLSATWSAGERKAWHVADRQSFDGPLPNIKPAEIAKVLRAPDAAYLLTRSGQLLISYDSGQTWQGAPLPAGSVVAGLYADPANPRVAIATLSAGTRGRVLRTVSAGRAWDDISGTLSEVPVRGVVADPDSGFIYLATDAGLFQGQVDLAVPGPAPTWQRVEANLPGTWIRDVALDREGNQLYVAVEGYGVFSTLAPHRVGRLRLVSAADWKARPLAPGALLSVLGGRVRSAQANGMQCAVLQANGRESQIQLPFDLTPDTVVVIDSDAGPLRSTARAQAVSPAIFVSQDGTPLVIDAESGKLVDGEQPGLAGRRVQILTSGLGSVAPKWTAGTPAPQDRPPLVEARIAVFLDRQPLQVERAVLAPGFTGVYLVEVLLPETVNLGAAELYLTANGIESNRARLWVDQR